MRMSQLKVGSTADIPLNITETDLSQLTATVTSPSGREEPCLLKRLRNGHIGETNILLTLANAHLRPCFKDVSSTFHIPDVPAVPSTCMNIVSCCIRITGMARCDLLSNTLSDLFLELFSESI